MKITIQWLHDSHDCDSCGPSYASGAHVRIGDASLVFNPVAHCFDSEDWTMAEIYEEILAHLGHEVEFIDE